MRATRDIEQLLVWAYRDELSKRITSSSEAMWESIRDYGARGGIHTDKSPQRYDFGEPHPDALAIESAVGALGKWFVDWDLSREALMGDLAGLMAGRDVLLLGSINVAALVTRHAVMETRPDWGAERPRCYPVPSKKNHSLPAIVGECRGHLHYTPGSHCPLRWEPSPISIALARADYAAWHLGLCQLVDGLDHLTSCRASPPAAPAQPWLTGETPCRIHLVGQWDKVGKSLPLKEPRPLAGPPPRRERPKMEQDTSRHHRNRKTVAKGVET